jgi:hypothetical protein
VTRTLSMRGSLLATVLTPSLQNRRQVYSDESPDASQLPGVETVIARE